MGHMGRSEAELRATSLNTIEVAWRGYQDKQDDFSRIIFGAQGVKLPDKKPRGPRKPVSFAAHMRARKKAAPQTT